MVRASPNVSMSSWGNFANLTPPAQTVDITRLLSCMGLTGTVHVHRRNAMWKGSLLTSLVHVSLPQDRNSSSNAEMGVGANMFLHVFHIRSACSDGSS